MLVKIISLFLIFMAVIAMFGRWRFPPRPRLTTAKCPACGRPRVGKGTCPCGKA